MATLWQQSDEGKFEAIDLPVSNPSDAAESGRDLDAIRIVPLGAGNQPSHALVSGDDRLYVNGLAVVGGIRVLQHKDELIVGPKRLFFSAESTPVADVYQHDGARRRPRCPVCRSEVHDGQMIVRCPGCARIFHQIEASDDAPEKKCWTYSPACRFCNHPTPMSGAPSWQPGEED